MSAAGGPPRAAGAPLAALAAVLALALLPLGEGEAKFHILEVAVGLLAAVLAWSGGLARPAPGLAAPGGLVLAWALVSLLWAPERARGVDSLLWLLALLFVAGMAGRLGPARLPALAALWVALSLAVLGHGLAQWMGWVPATGWANPVRLAGSFVNSNLYAAYAATVLLAGLGLAADAGTGPARRVLGVVGAVLAATTLPLTVSRGAWLAAAGGLLFLLWPAGRRLARLASLAGALAAILALAALSGTAARAGPLSGVRERLAGDAGYSAGHRLAIWRGTLRLVRARPYGTGVGGFEPAFPVHRVHSDRFVVNYAHCEPLELLAVLGVPGLALAATLLRRTAGATRQAFDRPARRGLAAALVALGLHSLVDFPLRKPALGAFAVAVLAAAGGAVASTRSRRLAVPCALALAALAAPLAVGDRLLAEARALDRQGALPAAEAAWHRADRWLWTGNAPLAREAGARNLALSRLPGLEGALRARALNWFGQAIARAPGDAEARLGHALALEATGAFPAAVGQWRLAAALAPRDGALRRACGDALARRGDAALAFRLHASALDLSPERVAPGDLAGEAARARLPAELVAQAPPASAGHGREFVAALSAAGMDLAARLYAARLAVGRR